MKRIYKCRSAEDRSWLVFLELRTLQQNEPIPYTIELEVLGNFRVAKEYPDAEVEKLIQVGGASILYSSAREFILILTSRGPWGSVFLPSISFKPEEQIIEKQNNSEGQQ